MSLSAGRAPSGLQGDDHELLPIRLALVLGNVTVISATRLEHELDPQPEVVHLSDPFGLSITTDEGCDELELDLDTYEE